MDTVKKSGRPRLLNPKNRTLQIRLTENDYERLEGYAILSKLSVSDFCRQILTKAQSPKQRLTEEQMEFLRNTIYIRAALRRLTPLIRAHNLSWVNEAEKIINMLDEVLKW